MDPCVHIQVVFLGKGFSANFAFEGLIIGGRMCQHVVLQPGRAIERLATHCAQILFFLTFVLTTVQKGAIYEREGLLFPRSTKNLTPPVLKHQTATKPTFKRAKLAQVCAPAQHKFRTPGEPQIGVQTKPHIMERINETC
ncbi:hypothetical protein TcasGA2_TC011474 [Tribolium castaneum]|uniref:Uncharacterized protein n=1 Tax=Tribolium castaneum TaxID=7070 RepID=D6X504_TRICA|nr:hypothetical protein TcasGA2_TC011474 [Tribolium castaneum]